jgi:hypothetical protein
MLERINKGLVVGIVLALARGGDPANTFKVTVLYVVMDV